MLGQVEQIYLDHASTTPLHPAAREALVRTAGELFADPARLYGAARRVRTALDDARLRVASSVGARPEEIVFTSGGTESCNTAVRAGALAARASRKPSRIAVSAIEHTAVLETARALSATDGFEVVEIPVSPSGVVDLDALRAAMPAGLVSIQHANQEIGTLQPVAEAARIARDAGALFHTDACMTIGNVPVSVVDLGADLVSASAHKFYGPKGAGFLWVRRGVRVRPMLLGDDRERHRRAGIENLPAIAGTAAALEARLGEIEAEIPRLQALSARLRSALPALIPDIELHGEAASGLPGLVAFGVPHIEGEAMLLKLDMRGIAVHSGSSCTSSATEPSHVLVAVGARTTGSIRVSFGRSSRPEDAEALLRELPPIVEELWKIAQ